MNDTGKQLVMIFLLFTLVNVISFFTQDRISVNGGKDYDGLNYYAMAEKFSEGIKLQGPAPYIYRIGTPFLASLTGPNNLIEGFFIVNLIANFISCFLLFFYLRMFLKNFSTILILMILYLTHWLCNTRFVYYAPINTDPWSMCFFISGLILLEAIRRKSSVSLVLLISVLSFAGVLFREYLLVIPLALLFIQNPFFNIEKSGKGLFEIKKIFVNNGIYFLPLLGGILGITLAHFIAFNDGTDYSFIRTAAHWLYNKTLLHYLRSVFIVFGPIIVLFVFFRKQVWSFLKNNQYILVILVTALVLSFVGGTDTERFLIWFFPVMLVIIGLLIENNTEVVLNSFFLITLIITQAISDRIFFITNQPMPEDTAFHFPALTQIGEGDFFNLTSLYANKLFGIISFAEYLLVTAVLYFMLRYALFKKSRLQNH